VFRNNSKSVVVPLVDETQASVHMLHLLLVFDFMACFIVVGVKGFGSVFSNSVQGFPAISFASRVYACACMRMRTCVRAHVRVRAIARTPQSVNVHLQRPVITSGGVLVWY